MMSLRTRTVLLGAALPLVLLAATAAVIASWLPRLPPTVALHWGFDGVDRVGPISGLLLPFGILSVVLVLPLVGAACLRLRTVRRPVIGLSVAMATLISGLALGSVGVQLDITDVADVLASPGAVIAWPLLAAILLGGLASWLAGSDPPAPVDEPVPDDAPRLDLPAGGSALWSAPLPTVPLLLPSLVLGPVLALTVVLGVMSGDWWLLAIVALIAALIVATLGWRVRADRTGMTITGVLGWPRYHVPADEIVRADVVAVRPVAEFGGWGVRFARRGTVGFVTRTGPGIAIERSANRRVVVTVDDAARGAALLNTVAERARSTSR